MVERKTVLVTGAASGIGLEIVRRFSKNPKCDPIYAADKDPSVHEIFPSLDFPSVVPIQTDIRGRERIVGILRRVVSDSGRLDVVVNCAGVMNKGRRATYNLDGESSNDFAEMEEINLWTPTLMMAEAAPLMRNNGGGAIINITSAKYLFPDMHHIGYQLGKMCLSRVTRGLARPFRENYGVRLVDVQPGNTRTNIDRGDWTNGNNSDEMAAVQLINDWWRKVAGNDPKNVAEIIYEVAEGKIKGSPVCVGLDTKIGRALFLATYPTIAYRWDGLFYAGSSLFYQFAIWAGMLRRKLHKS